MRIVTFRVSRENGVVILVLICDVSEKLARPLSPPLPEAQCERNFTKTEKKLQTFETRNLLRKKEGIHTFIDPRLWLQINQNKVPLDSQRQAAAPTPQLRAPLPQRNKTTRVGVRTPRAAALPSNSFWPEGNYQQRRESCRKAEGVLCLYSFYCAPFGIQCTSPAATWLSTGGLMLCAMPLWASRWGGGHKRHIHEDILA